MDHTEHCTALLGAWTKCTTWAGIGMHKYRSTKSAGVYKDRYNGTKVQRYICISAHVAVHLVHLYLTNIRVSPSWWLGGTLGRTGRKSCLEET